MSDDASKAHKPAQPMNPLHGLTLETLVNILVERHGWQGLADRIPVRCFTHNPSVTSTLKFLRKTPWARERVEVLYLTRDGGRFDPERSGP